MNVTVWNDFRPTLHPCAIESFDVHNEASCYRSSFLCGQYELDETNVGGPTRGGSIIACTVDSKSKELSWTTTDCQSGVLDMKVSGNFVASAQSDHTLFLHKIQHGDLDICKNDDESESMPKDKLVEVTSVSAADEGLFLSVDWDLGFALHDIPSDKDKLFKDCYDEIKYCRQEKVSRRCSMNLNCTSPANITVSTQQGSVIVYQLNNQNEFSEILHINNAHVMLGESMPVWITCFDPHSKKTLITGGDDCMMKLWDLRQGEQPTHTNKVHNAGVTSAQWHPIDEHVFASGSYDENLRIWDNRAMRSPVSEIHVGGGVWRTKWNILQDKSSFLFLSCMQGGSTIVEYDGISKTSIARVQQRDEKNENHLAYGIDVINIKSLKGPESSHLEEQEEYSLKTMGKGEGVLPGSRGLTVTVASCSFYDNLVQVWDAVL